MSDTNKKPRDEATEEVTTPVNDNQAKAVENIPHIAGQEPEKKKSRFLSIAFNIAAGAATTMATKAFVTSMMLTCTPLAVLLTSSLAVGAAMTLYQHGKSHYHSHKNQTPFDKFFTKKNAKKFAASSALALVGGAIFMGFQLDSFKSLFEPMNSAVTPALPDTAATTIVEPVVTEPVAVAPVVAEPVIEPVITCLSPMEQFTHHIDSSAVTERVTDALHRAGSDNIKIAAQGTKDLAYFTFNGFDGVPKNENLAIELFEKAANAGNAQAKTDLLYIQFHGLADVVTNPQAAVDTMQHIDAPRSDEFVKAWGDMGYKPQPGAHEFNSKEILAGMQKTCIPKI